MSEGLVPRSQNLSKYDAMTTQELEQILWLDSEAPEGKGLDTQTILHIMEVIDQRQRDHDPKAAQKAWDSFRQYYLPDADVPQDDAPEEAKPTKHLHKRPRRWLVAAAVIALLICIPLAVGAYNWDKTQDVLATWKDGIFSFESTDDTQPPATTTTGPTSAGSRPYASIQEAMAENGVDAKIMPTWIPERFTLVDITVGQISPTFSALYEDGDDTLSMFVIRYSPSSPGQYPIDDELVELYQSGGTDHYIFYNGEHLTAIWLKDSYECSIAGDLSLEEMKTMIDSIGK